MDDLGGNTEDLITMKRPHPVEPEGKRHVDNDEGRVRRYGLICLIVGLAILGLLVIIVPYAEDAITTNRPRLAVLTIIFALCCAGGAFLTAGLVAFIGRYHRTLLRSSLAIQEQVLQRLEPVECAIDRIAEHLPEDQQIRHWRGYNAAVRRGFTETGTDGPLRPQRLGLVRPDPPLN